jgi:hypothetical protein
MSRSAGSRQHTTEGRAGSSRMDGALRESTAAFRTLFPCKAPSMPAQRAGQAVRRSQCTAGANVSSALHGSAETDSSVFSSAEERHEPKGLPARKAAIGASRTGGGATNDSGSLYCSA